MSDKKSLYVEMVSEWICEQSGRLLSNDELAEIRTVIERLAEDRFDKEVNSDDGKST